MLYRVLCYFFPFIFDASRRKEVYTIIYNRRWSNDVTGDARLARGRRTVGTFTAAATTITTTIT